jgi:hypothetical protein
MAGCASPYTWVKNGSTPVDYERDIARCRYEAAAATAGYSTGRVAPTMGGAVAQGFGEGMAIGIRQSELVMLCMQANGYIRKLASSARPLAAASSPTASAAAVPPEPPAAKVAAKAADASTDPETDKAVQVLQSSGFPLVGIPIRFQTVGNRSYYEAWGTGGRLTQVLCESGTCRLRTIYD